MPEAAGLGIAFSRVKKAEGYPACLAALESPKLSVSRDAVEYEHEGIVDCVPDVGSARDRLPARMRVKRADNLLPQNPHGVDDTANVGTRQDKAANTWASIAGLDKGEKTARIHEQAADLSARSSTSNAAHLSENAIELAFQELAHGATDSAQRKRSAAPGH